MTRTLAVLSAVVTLAAAILLPAPAQAAGRGVPVRGGWVNSACAATDYDPATGHFHCTGSTVWDGAWTGVTTYDIEGTLDLLTSDSSGTIDETFTGRAVDGTTGTLHFTETFVVDAPSSTIHIDAKLIEGGGDWVGSTGRVQFDGLVAGTSGHGGYGGRWVRSVRR